MELNGFVAERKGHMRHINMIGSMAEGLVILSAGALATCGAKVYVVDHSLSGSLYEQVAAGTAEDSVDIVLGGVQYCRVWDNVLVGSGVVIHYYGVMYEGCGIDTGIPTYLIVDNDTSLSVYSDIIYQCELALVMRDDLGDMSLYTDVIGVINYRCDRIRQIYRLPLCREDRVCEVRAKRYADYAVKGLSDEYRRYLKGLCMDAGLGELGFSRLKKLRVESVG